MEKIVYIADYIEPKRDKAPNLAIVRKLAFQDLDECMYKILADTLAYLEENPKDKLPEDDVYNTISEVYLNAVASLYTYVAVIVIVRDCRERVGDLRPEHLYLRRSHYPHPWR